MRENSAKKNFLLIFAIILSVCPLYATAVFSHDEEKYYGPTALPHLLNSRAYEDGTVVVRIVRNNMNTSTTDKSCFYEMLSLRIIRSNGTVEEKDIKLEIQPFNYCFEFGIDYCLIRKNHILVTYYNATIPDDTYEAWGMIIDFDDHVYDKISFGFSYISENSKDPIATPKIQLNINREKGFIRYDVYSGTLTWQQYRIELNGTFTKLTNGALDVLASDLMTVIPTVDEGYAIVYTKKMNDFDTTEPFLPQSALFVSFIGYDQMPVSPLLLYQTSLPNVTFSGLSCANLMIQTVQVCTLTIAQNDKGKFFYAKINFLSSGSVTNLTVINRLVPDAPAANPTWEVNSLSFGGYLLTYYNFENQTIFGYLFGDDDAILIPWVLNEPEPISKFGVYQILHNNTLLVAQKETNNSWGFQVIDLPKFAGDRDKGYSNLHVKATFPEINSFVNPNITKISIDFYEPVELSNGNLSIYQVVDDQPYLRQSIPSILCSIENNGNTIIADVLESTFSVSEGSYFIKMDNNFVRDKAYKRKCLEFQCRKKSNTFPPTAGLLRLTSNGTYELDKLSQEQRNDFFNILKKELADAVPMQSSHLTTSRVTQLDNSVTEKQYLISIKIKAGNDNNFNDVASIIDTMVKYKDQTPIGSGQVTGYLDESYGFKQSSKFGGKIFGALLAVGLLIVLFVVLFLLAQKSDRNGNNIAILHFGVITFDLVMDILFVSRNVKDVPVLYLPSVLLIIISIGINTILAFHIITNENAKMPRFYHWFTAHETIANIITVLAASTDIKALNILNSNLAGFTFFRAPSFSGTSKSKIFLGTCLNIFVEDIPQVIIQIFYLHYVVVTNDITPLLALISSIINLFINILYLLYYFVLIRNP